MPAGVTLDTLSSPAAYPCALELELVSGLVTLPKNNLGVATPPKLNVRITEQPRVGFPEEGYVVRAGGAASPGTEAQPLKFNEQVTIVLETAGAPPTYFWEAQLTCPAFESPVWVGFDPADQAAKDLWEQQHRLEVQATFDARCASQTALTLEAHPGPARGPLPTDASLVVQLGRASRVLRFGKGLHVGFVEFDDGKKTRPAGPYQAGDQVSVRLKLSDEHGDEALTGPYNAAKLKSLAFRPPPPPPGQPRKVAPGGGPLPGAVPAKVPAGGLEHEVSFTIEVSPPDTADWELRLVEDPGSPYIPQPDGSEKLTLRVRPLPTVTLAPEQAGLAPMGEKEPEPQPTQPDPNLPPPPPPADYDTVVGAMVPIYAHFSGPVPARGAAFKVVSTPADLITVEGSPLDEQGLPTNVVEVSREQYDGGKWQDGTYIHGFTVVFNKRTTPRQPLHYHPPLPADPIERQKEQRRRALLPPWNHIKLMAVKDDAGAPAGCVVGVVAPPVDPNAPPPEPPDPTLPPEPVVEPPRIQFSVAVAGTSISFPTGEGEWWIKPAAWSEDMSQWSEEMREAVFDYLPFARGDKVTLRLQRNGGEDVGAQVRKTVAELEALAPSPGDTFLVADAGVLSGQYAQGGKLGLIQGDSVECRTQTVGGVSKQVWAKPLRATRVRLAGACAKVSSYAFGAVRAVKGGRGAGAGPRPVSHTVTWQENALLSDPVEVSLDAPQDLYTLIQGPKSPAFLTLAATIAGQPKEERLRFPLVPVQIAALTVGALPLTLDPTTKQTWATTHQKHVAWGAPAPGSERGLQLRAHRTVEWAPYLRAQKHRYAILDTVRLYAVLNAFATEDVRCCAHSLLFDEDGEYAKWFTIPAGSTSGEVEVVLRRATKLSASEDLLPSEQDVAPETGTTQLVDGQDFELEREMVHLEVLSTETCHVAKALAGEKEGFLWKEKQRVGKKKRFKTPKPVQQTGESDPDFQLRLLRWHVDQDAFRGERPIQQTGELEDDYQARLLAWEEGDPNEKHKKEERRRRKIRKACDLSFEVVLPRVRFAKDGPFETAPRKSERDETLIEWVSRRAKGKKKPAAVFGKGDRVTLAFELDRPAPPGCKVRLECQAFSERMAQQLVDVDVPEGATRFTHEVAFQAACGRRAAPLVVSGLPRSGHTDGYARIHVLVPDLPAVYLPAPDPEELPARRKQKEEKEKQKEKDEDDDEEGDDEDLGIALGTLFETNPAWITPKGPFAWHDTATVRVRLTEPAGPDGARANLSCKAFDQAYAVDFAPGALEVEVEVAFNKKPESTNQFLVLEGLEGCVAGLGRSRLIEVFPERVVYFPPRACLAPAGPFVPNDHCTLSLVLHPEAPAGGAEVTLKGPFADTPVTFEEGQAFRAVTVQLTREAEAPQVVSLEPSKACGRGRFTSFELVVRTPEVRFGPQLFSPEPEARVGEETSVVLRLSHPAPGPKPLDPTQLEELRQTVKDAEEELQRFQDEQKRERGLAKQDDESGLVDLFWEGDPEREDVLEHRLVEAKEAVEKAQAPAGTWGASVTLQCDAFVDREVTARFVPGATEVRVPVRIKPEESVAGPGKTLTILEGKCSRVKVGAATAEFEVKASPWVAFAQQAIVPGLGVRTSGRESDDVVYATGQTATLRITCEEVPERDFQVQVKSPAFGGKVYLVALEKPKATSKGPGKKKERKLPPVAEVEVTFVRGIEDGGNGKPKRAIPIELVPPRGWRPADEQKQEGKSALEVWVLAPTSETSCPYELKQDDQGDEVVEWVDPFVDPCNLSKVLLVEFHGELAPDPLLAPVPTEVAPQPDPNAPPPPPEQGVDRGPKVGTRETNLEHAKATTALFPGKRGPFELVRDLSLASDPGTALVYRPGEPPKLQVIAGPAGAAEPRFHATHISVQLPRDKFCRHQFEELRKIKLPRQQKMLEGFRARLGPQAALVLGPEPATIETGLRHHPIVNLRARKAWCGFGKFKRWKFVYPPPPNVRPNVALPDDALFPHPDQVHQGTDPKLAELKPGEDETTQKGYATAATFTLTPTEQLYQFLSKFAPPVVPQTDFVGMLGPVDTALARAHMGPVSGLAQPIDDTTGMMNTGTSTLREGMQAWTITDPQKGTELDLSAGFDPATGTFGNFPIARILQFIGFFGAKPKQYLLEVKGCGQPDPDAEEPSAPCEDLQCLIEVFPSDEFNLTWKFKPFPDSIQCGVDGQYVGGRGETKAWSDKEGYEKYQEEKAQEREYREDQQARLTEYHQEYHEREVDRGSYDPSQETGSTYDGYQDYQLDTIVDDFQAQTMRATDVEYRDEVVIPPRVLEGRYGQEGKLVSTGTVDPDQPQEAVLGSALDYQYREITRGKELRPGPEDGIHGGAPAGAAPGWKAPKDPGQTHAFKSKVFCPVGYGPTALGPIPAEDRPLPPSDPWAQMMEVCRTRVDERSAWQQENLQNAQNDVDSDVSNTQGGVQQAGEDLLGARNEDDIANALSDGFTAATLSLTKNGQTDDALQKVADGVLVAFNTVRCFTELFKRLGDLEFSFGFGIRFELAFLEGGLTAYWGFKESYAADYTDPDKAALQKEVFRWYSLHVDLILISLKFMADFGIKFSVGWLRFEAVVYARLQLDASVKSGFERRGPDTPLPAWVDTWWIAKARADLGLKVVLVSENVCAVNAALKTGIEFRWRFALPDLGDFGSKKRSGHALGRFAVEYEVHFPGLVAVLNVTILGGIKVNKEWNIIAGNPPELPLKRGILPGSAAKSFWNAEQMLKLAWNRMIQQKRQITRRLDRWQELQLEMVSASSRRNEDGSLRYPTTNVAPGYAFAGDPDDDDTKKWWEENKKRWEEQWEECKLSLHLEATKVRSYGKLRAWAPKFAPRTRKHLGEQLGYYVGRVEDLFQRKLFPRLDALEERVALLRELERQLEDEQQNADEAQKPSKKLMKALRRIERDPVLNWTSHLGDRPLEYLDKYFLRIAYYHPQREAW
ncbi:MAG: hypothetical protein AB7T09_26875 [Planctomycetota bacterium]